MREDLKKQIEEAKVNIRKELDESVATTPAVKYTHIAVGIFKDHDLGLWFVAEFDYNPITGHVSGLRKNGPLEDRTMAIETFKIRAANLDIVG